MDMLLDMNQTDSGKEGLLTLKSELTINNAQELHAAFLRVIEEVDILRLDLSSSGPVDVSFLQLLCSAHRECELCGKQLLLENSLSESVKELLQRAGYTRQHGCPAGTRKSCLWTEAIHEATGNTIIESIHLKNGEER